MAASEQERVMAGLRRYWSGQQLSPDLLLRLRDLPRAVVRSRAPESFAATSVAAAMISRAERSGADRFGWIGDSRSHVLAASAATLSRTVHVDVAHPDRHELAALGGCDHLVVDTFRGCLGAERVVQERILALVRSARSVVVLTQAGQATADAAALRAEFASYPVVDCRIAERLPGTPRS